jgi:Methyltransferase domain
MNKPVLVFPAGMPRALDYLQKCLREGRSVIGSSSLGYDPSQEKYPKWVYLPYVTNPEFNQALKQAVENFDIGEIYTPNIVVWNHLNQTLGQLTPGVTLANISPVDEALSGYRAALGKARYFADHQLSLASCLPPRPLPSEVELAALSRYADIIPGMCDDHKLHALIEVARHSVKGDIVEIGSWWGKSAFILARLAQCFDIGKLLCVDPWSNAHLVQGEKTVDSGSAQVDADEALTIFQIGLLPFYCNHINYLRMTSVDAAAHYKIECSVSTAAFGLTEYAGKISILHIDGNHAYEAAKADIEAWGSLVIAKGWIIVDDYVWPFGDGPKRVGDEFLERNYSRISTAFVMGTALFIQLTTQR